MGGQSSSRGDGVGDEDEDESFGNSADSVVSVVALDSAAIMAGTDKEKKDMRDEKLCLDHRWQDDRH